MHPLRLLSVISLCISAFCIHALPSSSYPSQSLFSSGRWVKIETDTTGIFQVTYDQLKAWGFSDPAKVSVYGNGAIEGASYDFNSRTLGDIAPAPYVHTSDSRILFFSQGDVLVKAAQSGPDSYTVDYTRNYYCSKAYYYLTDSRPQSPVEETSTTDLATNNSDLEPLSFHTACVLIEDEVQNPDKGGVFFHGTPLKAGESVRLPFAFDNYYDASNAPKASITIDLARLTKYFKLSVTPSDNIDVAEGSSLTPSINSFTSDKGIFSIQELRYRFAPATNAQSGNSAAFTLSLPDDAEISYLAVDKAIITYPQTITAPKRGTLMVNTGAIAENTPMTVAAAESASLAVWNVSDLANVKSYKVTPTDDGAQCTVTGSASNAFTQLAVFDRNAVHLPVKYIGQIENTSLRSLATPDMVIIATAALLPAAKQLGAYHRQYQNFDVLTVCQDDIFNEFASGSRTPAALRRFVKMLYDRNPAKLHYVLLYGPSIYDNRGIITGNSENYLPVYETESESAAMYRTTNFATDQYLGIVDDNNDISKIETRCTVRLAVGRIPARSAENAAIVNEKIRRRLAEPLSARMYLRAVMTSDIGDDSEHLKQANTDASLMRDLCPAISIARTDMDYFFDPNNAKYKDCMGNNSTMDALAQQLNAGTGLFYFCGHGNPTLLGSKNIYSIGMARNLKYNCLPMAFHITCGTYRFEGSSFNITEQMLFNPDGGAIGAIASCREVFLSYNKHVSNALAKAYASATSATCTGDLLIQARRNMSGTNNYISSSLGKNLMTFNLCGDPAIPLGAPEYSIAIDNVEATPFKKTRLKATVSDAEGNLMTSFNGPATVDVYDIQQTLVSRENPDPKLSASSDSRILTTAQAMVRNGVLETSFVLPAPSADGEIRIVVTATDSETGDEAAGILESIATDTASGSYGEDIDTSAPVVRELYIDSPAFTSGDICGSSFTLTAIIDPSETGLKTSTADIRTASRAFLDRQTVGGFIERLTPVGDGTLRADCRFSGIGSGRHSFVLNLINNAGESTSATLDFAVSYATECTLSCDADGSVRTAPLTFTAALDNDAPRSIRLSITAADGTLVKTADMTNGSYTWNLTDNAGRPVANGEYMATALYEGEFRRGGSNTLRFVVIK